MADEFKVEAMAMILLMVFLVAAVFGSTAAYFTLRKQKNAALTALVAIVLTVTVTGLMLRPARVWYADQATDRELEGLKMYRAMKKGNPALYAEVRNTMIEGIKKGRTTESEIQEIAPKITAMVPQYLSNTSDKAAINFAGSYHAGITELINSGGLECYDWMYPENGVSLKALSRISPATRLRIEDSMGEVITDAMEHPQAPPEVAVGEPLINKVVKKMNEQGYLEGLLLAEQKGLSPENKKKVCLASQSLFGEMLRLPEAERGVAIRYNFSVR